MTVMTMKRSLILNGKLAYIRPALPLFYQRLRVPGSGAPPLLVARVRYGTQQCVLGLS